MQDVILMLSIILEDLDSISNCQKKDADINSDRIVNINDIVSIVSTILGN